MSLPDDVRDCFAGYSFGEPCPESEIRRAEAELGAALPAVLRELYLAFDGFKGPTEASFFWPLFGREDDDTSLVAMNQFLRGDDLFPQGLMTRCLFFGDDGGGPFWGIRLDSPGEIIRWTASWGDEYEVAGKDLLEVWAAHRALYEDLDRMSEP